MMQHNSTGKTQGSAGYLNIVAMLIESYALESIWLLAIAMTANQGISVIFFAESVYYIEVSSPSSAYQHYIMKCA
jgi:hypothetical protein